MPRKTLSATRQRGDELEMLMHHAKPVPRSPQPELANGLWQGRRSGSLPRPVGAGRTGCSSASSCRPRFRPRRHGSRHAARRRSMPSFAVKASNRLVIPIELDRRRGGGSMIGRNLRQGHDANPRLLGFGDLDLAADHILLDRFKLGLHLGRASLAATSLHILSSTPPEARSKVRVPGMHLLAPHLILDDANRRPHRRA